jgi:hypothetical protein
MKQKIVIAGPKVHGVGYRPFLIDQADAEDAQLGAFINAVRARKPKKADVSGIRSEPFEGRVPFFVRTSILCINSQLSSFIDALECINEKMDNDGKDQRKSIYIPQTKLVCSA